MLVTRFEAKYTPEPNSGCWLWTATGDANGYGMIRVGDRMRRAHRVAYELFVGPIPKGKILDHLCRVRCCVNPQHLEPVTYKENARRGLTGINHRSKTHCPQGHEYSPNNLQKRNDGKRGCKICSREKMRIYYRNKRKARI